MSDATPPDLTVRLPAGWRDVVRLGEGAFGAVYAAVDPTGRAVAVKVLSAALAADPDAAWRFAAEYRMLARFDHPGLPTVRGEGWTEDGLPFYAMELATGDEPVSPMAAEVRGLLAGVAGVLAHLHARGFVHGDLKPENVRVAADGSVRVLDLGLVAAVGSRRSAIAGTPAYMAPAVLRQLPVAVADDLYALGVLGYALRAGLTPFRGSAAAIVRGHLAEAPAPFRAAEADAELDALIMRLLAKAAADRPASAAAVLALLAGEPEPQATRGLSGAPFVGRTEALTAWRELPEGGVLWLTGERGIGKTAVLDACRVEALLAETAWVGTTIGPGAPGAAARAVVGQALAAAGVIPAARVAAWLRGETPDDLMELEPAGRQAALLSAAAEALSGAVQRLPGGLAVGLDDAHRADVATREALTRLMRVAGPVRWVVTATVEGLDPAAGLAIPAGAQVLTIGPLQATEQAAWLAARLDGPAPASLVDALAIAAGGQPLVLDAMLEQAVTGGALRFVDGHWTYDAAAAVLGRAGDALGAVWRARVATLSAAARAAGAVMAVAAVAGGLPPRLLADAAAGEALAAAGLAASVGDSWCPAAPGVAEALLAGVAVATQRQVASRLAAAVVAGDALASLPLDRLALAARLALAGAAEPGVEASPPAEGAVAGPEPAALLAAVAMPVDTLSPDPAHLAALAGRRFLALPAPADALAMLDAAEACMRAAAPAERRALAFDRAEAARALGRLDVALAAYDTALTEAPPDAAAAVAHVGRAKVRQLRADYPGADGDYDVAIRLAADQPGIRARAETSRARLAVFQGRPEDAQALAAAAVVSARAGDRPAILAQALNFAAVLLVQRAPARAAEASAMLDEAIGLTRALGDRLGEGFALEGLGNARLAVGDLAGAAEAFTGNAAAVSAAGSDVDLLAARLAVARVEADRGNHPAAADMALDVASRASKVGRAFVEGLALAVAGAAHWRAGRLADAQTALDRALAVAETVKNAYMTGYVHLYRTEAAVALGDPAAARTEAELARAAFGPGASTDVKARLAVALAGVSDAAVAASLAFPLLASPDRYAARAAHHVLARLALAEQDPDAALDHALAAQALATAPPAWDAPWHVATDHLLVALAAHAGQDDATARAEATLAVAAANTDAPNPYALGAAGLLLTTLGQSTAGRAAQEAAAMMLADAPAAALAAWGLVGLAARVAPTPASSDALIAAPDLDAALEAIVAAPDADGVSAALLRGAIALAHADRGYVLAYEQGRLRQAVTQGLDYAAEIEAGFSGTIAAKALYEAEPVYVVDAASDTAFSAAASVVALGLRTVVALPLVAGDDVLGVLYMDREAVDPVLGPADLASLMALARTGAGLLHKLGRAASARLDATVWEARAEWAATLVTGDARAHLLDAAIRRLGAERGLWLSDGTVRTARRTGVRDATPDATGVSSGVTAWVRERGEPLVLVDAGDDADWADRGSVAALGLTTVWCLPAGDGDVLWFDAPRMAEGAREALAEVAALVTWAAPIAARRDSPS